MKYSIHNHVFICVQSPKSAKFCVFINLESQLIYHSSENARKCATQFPEVQLYLIKLLV